MRISFNLLGPQGSGKGTQADVLIQKFDFVRLDLGEYLRSLEASDDQLGQQIAEYLEVGKRVPAVLIGEVTRRMVAEADASRDILFDGLLRGLDELEVQRSLFAELQLPLPVIIFLNLDEQVALERLTHRRICSQCHARYQLKPGQPLEQCPRCGGELVIRHDDNSEAIRQRLQWYHDDTLPVVEFFRTHGTVIDIDASPSVDEVTAEIVTKVEAYYRSQNLTPPRKNNG